jgi:gliding motility-associated lipoprotein GldH
MKFSIGIILLALALNACDTNKVYEDIANLNNTYWLADSVKSFAFLIDQPNKEYNLLFDLRNGMKYPHSNIYVHYTIRDSSNTILVEELRNFQLFHAKSGYPFGSGSGNIFQHQFNLLAKYQFPYAGRYEISFEQNMRYDSLPQIYSVGLRVEVAE